MKRKMQPRRRILVQLVMKRKLISIMAIVFSHIFANREGTCTIAPSANWFYTKLIGFGSIKAINFGALFASVVAEKCEFSVFRRCLHIGGPIGANLTPEILCGGFRFGSARR